MRVHWIWFAHRPGLSDRTKARLMEQFRDPEDLYSADASALERVDGLTGKEKDALLDKELASSEKILEDCAKGHIQILTYRDAAYPTRLKNIPDPPMVLYYKGQLPEFDAEPVIGVVGTRKASAYGLNTARRMGYQLAKCGAVVVSGLAAGIDGIAMSGALTAGGKVVGVLGCGADVVYPRSNRPLFRDTEQYGCILTEFSPGTPPTKYNFPKRNRIISGLSNGVLVVEAPKVSGALITARRALDQGRDVFVVPGNIDQSSCEGSNLLLREGATSVATGWDILSEYTGLYPKKICREPLPRIAPEKAVSAPEREKPLPKVAQKPAVPGKGENLKKEFKKKGIDKGAVAPYSDVNKSLPKLSAEEQVIVDAIGGGEPLVDDVIAQTGLPTGKVLGTLTMLELRGVIRRLPGKRVKKK